MKNIIAYTDGSAVVCGPDKGKGGFGTFFPDLYGKRKLFSLGFRETKTGRMEVMALLYAIIALPKKSKERVRLTVYSDSEYVVKCFTEKRLQKWISAGWRNSSGKVKNQDLWEHILEALNERRYLVLEMIHIYSHQVEKEKNKKKKKQLLKDPHIKGNMIADILADWKRHKIYL